MGQQHNVPVQTGLLVGSISLNTTSNTREMILGTLLLTHMTNSTHC